MKRMRVLTIVLATAALFAVTARILAAPSPEFGVSEGPSADGVVAPDDAVLVDPVVEEPLRPLLPDTAPALSGSKGWCGPVGLVTGLSLLLLLCTMRVAPLHPNP